MSVLDAADPLLKVLQEVEAAQSRRTPLIPLGTRGNFRGTAWELIGYQTRAADDDEWEEYLLFNPYQGFRYLTQYDGHWNFVTPLEPLPRCKDLRGLFPAVYEGRVYRYFSGGEAVTTFVLGEFPWRVKIGDGVVTRDYIDPPSVLSAEMTNDEITWSKGDYVPGAEIWKTFGLPGSPPPVRGIYLNQPSPHSAKGGSMWATCGLMLLILVGLALFFATFSQREVVLREAHHFSSLDQGEPSFVTPVFELTGRTATLELAVNTDLDQDWAYFNFALIDDQSGEAFDFGREVSYYHDSDGSEGSRDASVLIPSVPPGRYYLRVEPEMDSGRGHSMRYDLTLRHDVPSYAWFWIAAGLLLIPPIVHTMRVRGFETQRWMNSDRSPILTRR